MKLQTYNTTSNGTWIGSRTKPAKTKNITRDTDNS